MVYPVLKDDGARAGAIAFGLPQKLTVEFNCLGVEIKTRLQLHIDIPLRSPVVLTIDKECSKETLVDRLAEKIVSNEKAYQAFKFGFIILTIFGLAYVVLTCNNLCKGKSLRQAVPCGGCICNCCCEKEVSKQGDATAQAMGNVTESTVLPRLN